MLTCARVKLSWYAQSSTASELRPIVLAATSCGRVSRGGKLACAMGPGKRVLWNKLAFDREFRHGALRA